MIEIVAYRKEWSDEFSQIASDLREALGLLEVALAKKQLLPQWARHDPEFAFIKDDPRYGALVGA
jgi:hypothetical protein